MNSSHNESEEHTPLDLYDPHEVKAPVALLWVAFVHYCCVACLGAIGNAMALWCVETCKKTRRPVKVLLCSVFAPSLVICLATLPVDGAELLSRIEDRPERISKTVSDINTIVYSILAQIELSSMAAVAMVRAVSVWAPQRPTLKLRGAAVLVFGLFVYSALSNLGLLGLILMDELDQPWAFTLITIVFFINTTLPALITGVAYILIIYAIQRNRRRLAANQHVSRADTSMDKATRAMLAVFFSNLIFGLPHSIYHLMGMQPYYMYVIFHVIYATHFMVDPLTFVWLNSGYRRKFFSSVRKVTESVSLPPSSSFFKAGSVSRSDQHQLSCTLTENVNVSRHVSGTVKT